MRFNWRFLLLSSLLFSSFSWADAVDIEVNLPAFSGAMVYRPYVAVWVEDQQGDLVRSVSVWRKEADWLKDMRRWWRKAGRHDQGELEAITGATRRAGLHRVLWDGTDQQGQPVPNGHYTLYIEAAREHGSRSLVRQDIVLGRPATLTTAAAEELGSMVIRVLR